ncbi:MAG: MliC family protein [Alphaproteobacteria bacterium]|nr:MliC family protein [Alphaproteobacteria bacterium]MCL2889657.1 MliC family protein [Alphaproteobacteria bacterium]
MRKQLLFTMVCGLFAMGLLAACTEQPAETVKMKCGDFDIAAKIFKDKIVATVDMQGITLIKTESASGVRYAGTFEGVAIVAWNKGKDWILIIDDSETIECVTE